MNSERRTNGHTPQVAGQEKTSKRAAIRMRLVMVAAIFAVEFLVMFVLFRDPNPEMNLAKALLDGVLLVLVLSPLLYLLIYRPLLLEISERKRKDEALRKARDELEIQVKERTAELASANEELRIQIAERMQAEEERGQLLEQLRTVNQELVINCTRIREEDKLKDEFISVAAHELKTPVTIMKGYAQALLRTTEDIPLPRRKMLEAINRGADRIDRIIVDLLDVSRLHLGHLELAKDGIDLPALVEQARDRMAPTTTKHHIRVVRADPVVVQGDRDRLEQVLLNLIDNAIRYSPEGGEVDVQVTVQGNEAVVSVGDHGVGIPRAKQARIFERLYRAHTGTPFDYGGMGAGLYISREIITRHGGEMWFESEEGRGSVFQFSLPLRGENGGG